jgi:hypothetical protein
MWTLPKNSGIEVIQQNTSSQGSLQHNCRFHMVCHRSYDGVVIQALDFKSFQTYLETKRVLDALSAHDMPPQQMGPHLG